MACFGLEKLQGALFYLRKSSKTEIGVKNIKKCDKNLIFLFTDGRVSCIIFSVLQNQD